MATKGADERRRSVASVDGETVASRRPLAGLVSGKPMHHYMIPIFDM
jgi:hypothetical protein